MKLRVCLTIAKDEWRYWRRSKLGVVSGIAVVLLITASLVSTVARIETERTTREDFQAKATETFENQPARHPHRMVHYGHYVFRVPPPLSVIDPGMDAYAGTVMFLEGHRQNSAVFSPRYAGAQAGPLADLSPAFAYQVLLPLLLIVLGYASITREREAKTDYLLFAASVTATELWFGKMIALASVALLSLLPLAIGLGFAIGAGEALSVALYMLIGYAAYLLAWVFLISGVSAWARVAAAAFSVLLACWVVLCVIMPPVAGSMADTVAPAEGKIATDLAVIKALRETGDGHNANDPSFARLRAQMLEQYDVEEIADLPVNFRGVVSQIAEAEQSKILNNFADARMSRELAQSKVVYWLGFFSPMLALKNFSVTTAGTDLRQYHDFLRDAESVRFNFVQNLNKVHAEELGYTVDMQRGKDGESEQRARVSGVHWRMLEDVSSKPRDASQRIADSLPHLFVMLLWCALMSYVGVQGMRKGQWDVR